MVVPDNYDEEYYLAMNPDVELAVQNGLYKSGKEHFVIFGHKENRVFAPRPVTDNLGGGYFPPQKFAYPYSSVGNLKPFSFSERSLEMPKDLKLIQRIYDAYKVAKTQQPNDFRIDKSGMWSLHMQRYERDLISPLKKHEFEKVAETLSEVFVTNLTQGMAMAKSGSIMVKSAPKPFASVWADELIRLGEALAIIKVRNIEQKSNFYAPLDPDIDQLFMSICKKLTGSSTLTRPSVGKIYGIQVGSSIWNIRDLGHMLAASTIKDFALNYQDTPVMEIGGGYGGLAYWLYTLGFRNITVYDLPEINILQSYFLTKTLPNAKISLYNDSKSEIESAEIRILPYWHLDQMPSKSFGISINQDSLPEIPEPIAIHYLKEIKRTTRDFFYSVNQEAGAPNNEAGQQNSVPELVDKIGNFHRKLRTPFWCRSGYVQELYEFS